MFLTNETLVTNFTGLYVKEVHPFPSSCIRGDIKCIFDVLVISDYLNVIFIYEGIDR